MATCRRTEITTLLINSFKTINESTSPFDSLYIYKSNLFNNVYRGVKFLDEINDFPSAYLQPGTETRDFNTKNLTNATLDVTIRVYIYSEDDAQNKLDNVLQDLEHVIYNIGDNPEIGLLDINISNISTDEGLVSPYGIGEIELTINYLIT